MLQDGTYINGVRYVGNQLRNAFPKLSDTYIVAIGHNIGAEEIWSTQVVLAVVRQVLPNALEYREALGVWQGQQKRSTVLLIAGDITKDIPRLAKAAKLLDQICVFVTDGRKSLLVYSDETIEVLE